MNSNLIEIGNLGLVRATVKQIVDRMTTCLDDGEDITQEVMIKVIRSRKKQIKLSWLYTVARTTAMDDCRGHLKHRKRLRLDCFLDNNGCVRTCHLEEPVYEPNDWRAEEPLEPDDAKPLLQALAQLTESSQKALMLWAYGYSYVEIARATKASIGTVRSRVHYAKLKVIAALTAARQTDSD
jgi:RNA polymerase sigma factor (sigma-70 family)